MPGKQTLGREELRSWPPWLNPACSMLQLPGSLLTRGSSPHGTHQAASSRM